MNGATACVKLLIEKGSHANNQDVAGEGKKENKKKDHTFHIVT